MERWSERGEDSEGGVHCRFFAIERRGRETTREEEIQWRGKLRGKPRVIMNRA
uniref:Uncharacterized protein n=1 Tax=Nelumbo nucifera TaxID=4432 RepID=A0A822YI42_NELNU|nr:TPA_asm: hypothetical protein HUJ06_010644 [Nelumbo nucifera]